MLSVVTEMSPRPKYTLKDFPRPGTVFAMPLADGRVGVCRVLRVDATMGAPAALVAASDWISEQPPQLNDRAVRRILVLDHHSHGGRAEVIWIVEPPPEDFRKLGEIEVVHEDEESESNSFSGWTSLSYQVLAQWRWHHDREAVLAEDTAEKDAELAARAGAARKRAAYLSAVSFSDLLAKDLFPQWEDYPPDAAKAGCQRIIQSFIRALEAVARPLDRDFVARRLKQCIEEINHLDSQEGWFIETIEREDLCEVLEEILNAAKFPGLVKRVDEWRDW
jgi:hypothetical protein